MSFSDRQPKTDPTVRIISSPGPTSPEGKAISSKNSLRHGCCATDAVLLPHESADDLKALEVLWRKTYNPQSEAEYHLVAELVNADFLLQRTNKAYLDVQRKLYADSADAGDWTEAQERKLARHLRYRTAQVSIVAKCRKAIEDYRKARLTEKANIVKETLAKERLEIYKRKNRPEPTWKEHLENMRQKAIAMGITPPERPGK